VAGELRRALNSGRRNKAGTVLMLRAAPEWRDAERFDVDVPGFGPPASDPGQAAAGSAQAGEGAATGSAGASSADASGTGAGSADARSAGAGTGRGTASRAQAQGEDGGASAPADSAATGKVQVAVAACPTVLSVLAALAAEREPGRYLVILTPLEGKEIGDSVLARGIRDEVKSINRWDLVQDAFGARLADPALTTSRTGYHWVAEALLDAQPPGGWRRLAGPVLTLSTALNRLAAARLGIEAVADESGVDAASLLEWTTQSASVARFLALREEERAGIITWLNRTAGHAAEVIFRMDATGKITDAVPFGLVMVALCRRDDTLAARIRAEERYLAGPLQSDEATPADEKMKAFGEAAESLVARWAYNGHAPLAAAMSERAELILRDLGGSAAAGESKVLEAGLDARLAALAEALSAFLSALPAEPLAPPAGSASSAAASSRPASSRSSRPTSSSASAASSSPPVSSSPAASGSLASPFTPLPAAGAAALTAVEDGLDRVRRHSRTRGRDSETEAATSAVRLARWLATPAEPPGTLADEATRMLRCWAWADRCLEVIYRADTSRVPRLASVYASLWERARTRRAGHDEAFARKLATWTQGSAGPEELLLAENLLERVARPVADTRTGTEKRLPVIIVLDGMTAAIGSELAGEITAGGLWLEAGRRGDGREPVLSTVPSVTAISRTSLLTGTLQAGGQPQERAGFAAFWGRRKSRLFHKADLLAAPGQPIAVQVSEAIAEPDTIVGVVLNAIDDSLDSGPRPLPWKVQDIDYLRAVLIEARRASRPVILTADHGHVLDRGADLHRGQVPGGAEYPEARRLEAASPGSVSPESVRPESARYRTGTPGPGEITVRGPRVFSPAGKLSAGDALSAAGKPSAAGKLSAAYNASTSDRPGGSDQPDVAGGNEGPGWKPGGEVVAAVDEAIRYLPRKAGYHGGASPAEVVVPVITLLPSASLLPSGWHAYDAAGHAPAWWHAPASRVPAAEPEPAAQPLPSTGKGKRKTAAPVLDDPNALFGIGEVEPGLIPLQEPSSSAAPVPGPAVPAGGAPGAAAPGARAAGPGATSSAGSAARSARAVTLGAQVAASERMAAQRQFVRRAPDDASIAALIDALAGAGGRLTVSEAAAATGQPPVRMSGYLAQVTRLLNVDSYPVLTLRDGGATVELNTQLLRQQFPVS
jgi:hypothetical protein